MYVYLLYLCAFKSVCSYMCVYHIYCVNMIKIVNFLLSLSMLVLNSRDWHEKYGNQILHTSKHALNNTLCLRKSNWNAF